MTIVKKFYCFLLSLVLLFCSLFTGSVYTADTVTTGYIFETDVNIRKDASVKSKALTQVSKLDVSVLGTKNDIDGTVNTSTDKVFLWYKISFTLSGETVTGYVREDLIRVTTYVLDEDFESQLLNFPKSYRTALKKLHAVYPNWVFIADKVPTTFSEAVNSQDYLFYKLTQSKYNSWRSMRKGCYNWSTEKFVLTDNSWYGASREVIAYYMDPRNFLNSDDIYIYMRQSYDASTQTVAEIENILEGTFLDAEITDKNDTYYGKCYAAVIRLAGKKSSVNALVLASTILQEQGIKGSTLSKGTTYSGSTVYNFFNFGANGDTPSEVLENGKKYAYNSGWTTPSKSIIQGAVKYGNDYIEDGQDTYFYKNYNVLDPQNLWHQYAQNVADSLNSAKFLQDFYSENTDLKLVFRIPVFEELPETVSKLPAKSSKLNNYYFSDIKAEGLTPSFNRFTYEYSMSADGNAEVYLKTPDGAVFTGSKTYSLKKGDNQIALTVKSQTGYTSTYTLNVDATKAAKLYIKTDGTATDTVQKDNTSKTSVVCGDTNGDNTVSITDLANVRLHLLEIITLKGDGLKGADTNNDGKLTITDLANIRLHLLKIITLK